MADRLTTQILDALSRASRAPSGLPLFGKRGSTGLFPITALGKSAAQRAQDEGWLAPAGNSTFALTQSGADYLLRQTSPRQVLEDVARAVEARSVQIDGLVSGANELRSEIGGLKKLIAEMAQRLGGDDEIPRLDDDLRQLVIDWPSAGDCPLPDLFQRLRELRPTLTIGGFHDLLRRLHAEEVVYLHPWTGPLYRLPEPALALLVGHEVAYYASLRVNATDEPRANADSPRSRWPAPVLS